MADEAKVSLWKRPFFKFTWLGLIVIAAIAGIVAVVARASYGDYVHRSQMSEAVALLGAAKAPLAEYYGKQGRWPHRLEQAVEATGGKYTASVAITRGAGTTGEIELTATMRREGVDRRVRGHTVILASADGGRTWVCRHGTSPAKNLPPACRN